MTELRGGVLGETHPHRAQNPTPVGFASAACPRCGPPRARDEAEFRQSLALRMRAAPVYADGGIAPRSRKIASTRSTAEPSATPSAGGEPARAGSLGSTSTHVT